MEAQKRLFGDENVAPTIPASKAVHKRSTSTSGLVEDSKKVIATTITNGANAIIQHTHNRTLSTGGPRLLADIGIAPINPAGRAQAVKGPSRTTIFRDPDTLLEETEDHDEDTESSTDSDSVNGDNTQEKEFDVSSYTAVDPGHELLRIKSVDSDDTASDGEQSYSDGIDTYDTYGAISQLPGGYDDTTGATVVLIPKESAVSIRELITANDIVSATRYKQDQLEDEFDITMVAEYSDEIFAFLRQKEVAMLPAHDYMANQAEIQWTMRAVLMEWIVQVHSRFGLLPETLFLTANYIDRFLSKKVVSLGKLQLVGATALFIAAKYEEITPPSINEIVFMVDNGYSRDEILKAEKFMLNILKFELGWPGPLSFLRRVSKADGYDLETRTVAKYFLDITIMDERFVSTPPAIVPLRHTASLTPAHAHFSGYIYQQLVPALKVLIECCEDAHRHHAAIYDKYQERRFKRASVFVQCEIEGGFVIPEPTWLDNPDRFDGRENF
ncbi:hypothetical protein N7495_005749 [Penicillium taxi]|uniref:uncharacterized protein n=1 Tax=Penicillium taxi TaxID=168475 RepID=UPI0025457D57|nr:uncharacterized protein N7495_005749 [Penicillium taxi]KAJ5894058.1 hypothetical protein N7495_005749 [Penicillium taxi]